MKIEVPALSTTNFAVSARATLFMNYSQLVYPLFMFGSLTFVTVTRFGFESRRQVFAFEAVPQTMHHVSTKEASFELLTSSKKSSADNRPRLGTVLPIVTANGFTILEGSRVGGTTDHRFRVRHSTGSQQNVSVRFDRSVMARVDQVRKSHLWIGSRFWAFQAEAYLEAYLIEKADYPPKDQLLIEELSDDEMLLAAHWKD
ncbi:MAG TPA: hypothetical protein DC054_06650 [Blastocatellia bacterium]|nr:hypothetical protein [Blastocatellia bacterium]